MLRYGCDANHIQNEAAKIYYTDIDLHKKTSFITAIDKNGQIVKQRSIGNDEVEILRFFLTLDDDTQVVIKSTANWY